jgi:hypothetical protein
MKIAVFSSKAYDKEYLDKANGSWGHEDVTTEMVA